MPSIAVVAPMSDISLVNASLQYCNAKLAKTTWPLYIKVSHAMYVCHLHEFEL